MNNYDRLLIDSWADKYNIDFRKLVAINPVARWKTKLWEKEKFAELSDWLNAQLGFHVVFTGSQSDRSIIEDIINRSDYGAINLAGKTSLKELAYLYSRCRLLISTDTGPMHIAAAMRCRVIALFGPTAPWRTGPYGKGHIVIRNPVDCSPCFRKNCRDMRCMRTITTDMVKKALLDIIDE